MRKAAKALLLIASIVVASTGVQLSSTALAVPECQPELAAIGQVPEPDRVVEFQDGEIRLNPLASASYALAVANHFAITVPAFVDCRVNTDGAAAMVNCTVGVTNGIVDSLDPVQQNFRYVYIDPGTNEVVIDYGTLVADERAIVEGCLGIKT